MTTRQRNGGSEAVQERPILLVVSVSFQSMKTKPFLGLCFCILYLPTHSKQNGLPLFVHVFHNSLVLREWYCLLVHSRSALRYTSGPVPVLTESRTQIGLWNGPWQQL